MLAPDHFSVLPLAEMNLGVAVECNLTGTVPEDTIVFSCRQYYPNQTLAFDLRITKSGGGFYMAGLICDSSALSSKVTRFESGCYDQVREEALTWLIVAQRETITQLKKGIEVHRKQLNQCTTNESGYKTNKKMIEISQYLDVWLNCYHTVQSAARKQHLA